MAKNHSVTIATHAEFGPWIESHGIKFHELAGNPAEYVLIPWCLFKFFMRLFVGCWS